MAKEISIRQHAKALSAKERSRVQEVLESGMTLVASDTYQLNFSFHRKNKNRLSRELLTVESRQGGKRLRYERKEHIQVQTCQKWRQQTVHGALEAA